MRDFAVFAALIDRIHHDHSRTPDDCRIEFLLARAVRAHCCDMRAAANPLGAQQRFARWCCGYYQVSVGRNGFSGVHRPHVEAQCRHLLHELSAVFGARSPYEYVPATGYRLQIFQLQPRLHTAADNANPMHLARREQSCGELPGERGAHAGEPALVLQQGDRFSCRGGKEHDQAVVARQALLGVVVEAGRDLDRESRCTVDISGLDTTIAIGCVELEVLYRGHLDGLAGVSDETFLDHPHRAFHIEARDDLVSRPDFHLTASMNLFSMMLRPQSTTATARP